MSKKRTITVTGTGKVSVKPDTVEIGLSLSGRSADYDQAVSEAAERIEALQRALEKEGFPKDALRTGSFNVSSEYDNIHENGVYRRVFKGYVCSYGLNLRFPLTTERLSAALSAIGESGAKPETNLSFTVKDPEAVRDQVLADAAGKAKRSAEALCRAAGGSLGELIRVEYVRDQVAFHSPTRYMMTDAAAPMMKCAGAMEEAAPEDVDVSDSVMFTWELC